MKFTKTLASIAAAAIAVSSLAVSAFAGSITFSDSGWWTQKDLKIEDVLDGNKPEDIESITFTSDTTFFLGYNSTEVTDTKTGSTWKQNKDATDSITVSDAVLVAQDINGNTVNPAFSVMLSKGDSVDYTIEWKVNLKSTDPVDPVDPADPEDPVDPGETEDPAEPAAPFDVTISNSGKTVVDSGLVRTNIINAWAGDDACVIADKAAFAGANKVSVKFTVTNFTTPFKAWISMADTSWDCQFWGADNAGNKGANSTIVDVTGNGTYVVTVDLDKIIDGMDFIAVCTDLEASEDDAIPTIAIDQVRVNEEITVTPGDTTDPVDPVDPGKSDEPVEPGQSSGEPVSPDTGVAVAVIPAALAAAAVATAGIVLKKRSK